MKGSEFDDDFYSVELNMCVVFDNIECRFKFEKGKINVRATWCI